MEPSGYRSLRDFGVVNRREFVALGGLLGAGLLLGTPPVCGQDEKDQKPPEKPKTNIDEILKIPHTEVSLPGAFPGKVVQVHDPQALVDDTFSSDVISSMFERGMTTLTGKNLEESFALLFSPDDVVGIKVNPVGSGLISTRLAARRPHVEY